MAASTSADGSGTTTEPESAPVLIELIVMSEP